MYYTTQVSSELRKKIMQSYCQTNQIK